VRCSDHIYLIFEVWFKSVEFSNKVDFHENATAGTKITRNFRGNCFKKLVPKEMLEIG
jgi:hypothetical protein